MNEERKRYNIGFFIFIIVPIIVIFLIIIDLLFKMSIFLKFINL
nr:MAG TPA: hypothetical protein [Crassvirales sp.]